MSARSGKFGANKKPVTDLSVYQIGVLPTPTAATSGAATGPAAAAPAVGDYGSDYWNNILGSGNVFTTAQGLEASARDAARESGNAAWDLQIRQGGGFGEDREGTSVQQALVDSGSQMWVSPGTTAPVLPPKPTVAPPAGVMPVPTIPKVTLPLVLRRG